MNDWKCYIVNAFDREFTFLASNSYDLIIWEGVAERDVWDDVCFKGRKVILTKSTFQHLLSSSMSAKTMGKYLQITILMHA